MNISTRRAVFALRSLALAGAALLIGWRFHIDMQRARVRAAQGSVLLQRRCGSIEYQGAGTGVPLLAVHGSGGGHDQGMLSQALWQKQGIRLIAMSRFGRTPSVSHPHRMTDALNRRSYPPVRFLLLLSCGRLDARGAFTGGAVARTCSRLAVASVCPREGRCDGPGGLSGDCDGRGFFGCVMVVSRLLSRGTARGYDGLEISDSACAAGSICERSTAKSPSATMPIKRLSRSTTGRRLTWRSLISLAAFSTESSS